MVEEFEGDVADDLADPVSETGSVAALTPQAATSRDRTVRTAVISQVRNGVLNPDFNMVGRSPRGMRNVTGGGRIQVRQDSKNGIRSEG